MTAKNIFEAITWIITLIFTYVIAYGLGVLIALVLSPIIIMFALIKAILDL